MIELIKKTLLIGTGLAFMTKEKVEEAAKKIAQEAKIAEGEGRKFAEELARKSEEAKKDLEKIVNDAVAAAFARLDIPTKADLRKLEERIGKLERKE